jgi:hypothetical protein
MTMWQLVPRLVLFLFMSSLIQTAAPPVPAVDTSTADSRFLEVYVAAGTVQVEQTQQLSAKLAGPPGELVILTLSITYPSGYQRTQVASTLTNEATLTWVIPPEAGVGTATYQVATGGCGCGFGRDGTPKAAFSSIATGSFRVE